MRLACILVVILGTGLAFGQTTSGETNAAPGAELQQPQGRIFYVRSTNGSDHRDGKSPETAWLTVRRGVRDLAPGDTLIIGPGLYREGTQLNGSGLPGRPLRIQGDPSGQLTGDSPGPVVMAGSFPVDENLFEPEGTPGVFVARFDDFEVVGVVEMDGRQRRYRNVREPISDIPFVERVRSRRNSYWYDKETSLLYIHTSDDAPPQQHELELISFFSAFYLVNKPHVWVSGLTFRHFADAGVYFRDGSDHGRAYENVAFGSRQGFRVLNSHHVQILNTVMFEHENSGVYFLRGSTGGLVADNFSYANAVGIRFSSDSSGALVTRNLIQDNEDGGLSFERVSHQVASHNTLRGNETQLRLISSEFTSYQNCFELQPGSDNVIATLDEIVKYPELRDYSAKFGQDLDSGFGTCPAATEKVDVMALHRHVLSYSAHAGNRHGNVD